VSRDALDDLAKRLFEAAREEPLPRGALERATAAAARARAETSPPRLSPQHWATLALGLAAAAGVALAVWHSRAPEHVTGISAEPTTTAEKLVRPKPEPRQAPSAEPTRASAPSATPTPAPVRSTTTTPAPSRSPGASTLGDELEALKRAEQALGSGDSKSALDALDHYEHGLHGHELRAEAALLRMDALKRAGHADQAAALATRFVAENPGSPLVDRARTFMDKPPATQTGAQAPHQELP
jgi:hypothetical protein